MPAWDPAGARDAGGWSGVQAPPLMDSFTSSFLHLPLPASILSSLQIETAQLRVDRHTDRACTPKDMCVIEDNFNLSEYVFIESRHQAGEVSLREGASGWKRGALT